MPSSPRASIDDEDDVLDLEPAPVDPVGVMRKASASSLAEKRPLGGQSSGSAAGRPAGRTRRADGGGLFACLKPARGRMAGARSGGGPSVTRFSLGECPGLAEDAGLDERLGGEFESLEPLECLLEAGPADHDAVILQDHAVGPGGKRRGDVLAQRAALLGRGVGGEAWTVPQILRAWCKTLVSGTLRQMLIATSRDGWIACGRSPGGRAAFSDRSPGGMWELRRRADGGRPRCCWPGPRRYRHAGGSPCRGGRG